MMVAYKKKKKEKGEKELSCEAETGG